MIDTRGMTRMQIDAAGAWQTIKAARNRMDRQLITTRQTLEWIEALVEELHDEEVRELRTLEKLLGRKLSSDEFNGVKPVSLKGPDDGGNTQEPEVASPV